MNEWSFLIQHGRIQDACHHQVEWEWISLSQIKLVWVRVRVEWECFWVNLGEENKESESNMLEFKMAVIIKLSQNEWVKVFFVQMVGTNLGKCEWDWEEKLRWLNPRWWNSRWLPSSSWMRMNEFESDWISLSQSQSGVRVFLSEFERRKQGVWIQDGSVWIQHGRIQGGCHHQVESEWMSEGFFCANGGNPSWQVWVSLREKTKVAESKMEKFKMAEIKMAAIIKLSENEKVWVRLN